MSPLSCRHERQEPDRRSTGHDRRARQPRQDATVAPTVTVPEAARILGVSTDAVRSRLRRRTLSGMKVAGEWHVSLTALHDARQGAQPSPTGTQQDTPEPQQDATVERQEGRPSWMWQTRAVHLEDQLKQLAPGETMPQTVPEPPGSPRSDETGPRGLLDQLRRWLALGRSDRP